MRSESYNVQAAAFIALALIDPTSALQLAKNYELDNKAALTDAILDL